MESDFQHLIQILQQNQEANIEQAIAALQEDWEAQQRERGDGNGEGAAPQGQQQPPNGQDQGPVPPPTPPQPPQRQASPERPLVLAPKADNPLAFNPDKTVSSALSKCPSKYAIKRLEAFKYVPLWYFSLEGLADAARSLRQSDAKDSLMLTQVADMGLALHPTITVAAFKQARFDHNLTFSEFLFAKNNFMTSIEHAEWPAEVVNSFNWFFYNLDTHQLRQEGERGDRVLLHYASRVRAHWHDALPAEHFNIATINESLVNLIA